MWDESLEVLYEEPARKKKVRTCRQHIIINKELEEGFTNLIQHKANDQEWEEFCVRNSFVSIYFLHFKLFLPMNTHSPKCMFLPSL